MNKVKLGKWIQNIAEQLVLVFSIFWTHNLNASRKLFCSKYLVKNWQLFGAQPLTCVIISTVISQCAKHYNIDGLVLLSIPSSLMHHKILKISNWSANHSSQDFHSKINIYFQWRCKFEKKQISRYQTLQEIAHDKEGVNNREGECPEWQLRVTKIERGLKCLVSVSSCEGKTMITD